MSSGATRNHFFLTAWVLVGASSCQDSFMKQTTADKTGAISRMAASVDDSGNVVASFDPTKAGTQLLSVASGAVSGAAIAIPPGSLSIPVSITVGEGVALASTNFTKQLGLTGNTINASGPSVSFTASQDVVAGNPFTLSIPFSALALTLAEVDTSNLVVMYRWTKVENGETSFEIGVIPGDKVIKGAGKVSFQTTKFGTFQVGVAETKITKTVLANTDEPPALKSCERYAAAVFPTCTADGQTGCVTTKEFTSAAVEGAETKLLAEKTLGGVKGTVSLPAANKVLKDTPFGIPASPTLGTASARPDNCGTNAQQDCVATGTYFAATKCDADGSNCFLPQFGTPTSQTKKAVDVSSIDPAKMLTTQTIGGIRGTVSGAAPANCIHDGEKNCIATTDFPAAKIADAASKILINETIGGVTGNITLPSGDNVLWTENIFGPASSRVTPRLFLPSASDVKSGVHFGVNNSSTGSLDPGAGLPANCNSENQTGCVANDNYPSVDKARINNNTAKILNGFSVAGVQGAAAQPPPLCNLNVQSGCFASGDVNPWDIRAGVSINGVPGKLKTNCRNMANLNIYSLKTQIQGQLADSPGVITFTTPSTDMFTVNELVTITPGTIQSGLSLSGVYKIIGLDADSIQIGHTATGQPADATWPGSGNVVIKKMNVDIWETIDDQNFTAHNPPIKPLQWPDTTQCGGTESTPGDDNVWRDVTTANGTTASTCTATPANCTMQDKITGLWWSKMQAKDPWYNAWNNCRLGSYNNQTGWRLPTQKEMMEAYTHGIRSIPSSYGAANNNWMTEASMLDFLWTGSSVSHNNAAAWGIYLGNGDIGTGMKDGSYGYVCVR